MDLEVTSSSLVIYPPLWAAPTSNGVRRPKFLIVGNMSNPAVNRWGLTTYWHSLWYSDVRYSLNVRQDALFEDLIHSYITHGLEVPQHLFFHPSWYRTQRLSRCWQKHQRSYFRWFTKPEILENEKATYRLRQTYIDAYYMRLWILKVDRWLIFNLYWFQPMKRRRIGKKHPKDAFYFSAQPGNPSPAARRVRLALFGLLNHYREPTTRYIF